MRPECLAGPAGFHARYPDIQIDLGVTDRPVDLIAENVDCVIRAGELTDQSLIARRIADLHFITCAAPSYLTRHGEPRHPSDLDKDHHVVSYFSTRSGQVFPLRFLSDDGEVEMLGRYVVSVNDGNAYVAAALSGLGVVQAPTFMVQQHPENCGQCWRIGERSPCRSMSCIRRTDT